MGVDMTPTFTLLIVDDEKQNRALLTELLQGGTSHHPGQGRQTGAGTRARTPPDLILLDVLMPEMDGYTVIRALKNDDLTRNIPVIFITALDSAGDEERGLELGAVDYISKPFNPAIVRVRIRNHLQSVQQRRMLEQMAMLDSLTGIPNRRRFNEVFEQEWRRCMRDGVPLSLIVVDVDHFKAFNDTYGHAAGDEVLRRIANHLADLAASPRRLCRALWRRGIRHAAARHRQRRARPVRTHPRRCRSRTHPARRCRTSRPGSPSAWAAPPAYPQTTPESRAVQSGRHLPLRRQKQRPQSHRLGALGTREWFVVHAQCVGWAVAEAKTVPWSDVGLAHV
jgi:CheY-like chemotaxis protein